MIMDPQSTGSLKSQCSNVCVMENANFGVQDGSVEEGHEIVVVSFARESKACYAGCRYPMREANT